MRGFYTAVNARDLDSAASFLADDVLYEDMIYAQPFSGKAAVRAHLARVFAAVPRDFQFVVDDVTAEDTTSAGLTWHVELSGVPFPFGRGVSFYRLDGAKRRIAYARDCPEPASKPGDSALRMLSLVAPILPMLPSFKGNSSGRSAPPPPPPPPKLPPLPGALSPALWAVFGVYFYALLLSDALPGEPVYDIQPHTLQAVLDSSLDFFYLTPILHSLLPSLDFIPAPAVNPVDLALFNWVNAWSFMFLGLLATDSRAKRLPLLPLWSGQMFLTNLFMLPWLAQRAADTAAAGADADADAGTALSEGRLPAPLASLAVSPSLGLLGGAVGLTSLLWFLFAPDAVDGAAAGDVAARLAHLRQSAATDRLQLAFLVDCAVYAAAQAWLIRDEHDLLSAQQRQAGLPQESLPPRWLAALPFAGMAAWLALRPAPKE